MKTRVSGSECAVSRAHKTWARSQLFKAGDIQFYWSWLNEIERAFLEEVVSTNRLTDLAAVKGSFWVMERPSVRLDFQKVLRRISYGAGRRTTSRDFVARGRPLSQRFGHPHSQIPSVLGKTLLILLQRFGHPPVPSRDAQIASVLVIPSKEMLDFAGKSKTF